MNVQQGSIPEVQPIHHLESVSRSYSGQKQTFRMFSILIFIRLIISWLM